MKRMDERQGDLEQAALIFERARELKGDARRAYLDEACNTNAALRTEILSMLEAEAGQGKFLSDPTLSVSRPLSEGPGTVIDNYKLLQLIGEGGFGVVYMAEQTHPVKRRVALKIIKLGMDTKQVIARFEAERQALAMMDHPNIAKVLDAGATETGRPYFIMELVKGVAITDYCDTENLTTKARLDLFITICNAVQHAHQKGIIHRDLKPSNVMVTLHDGKPVPKVIDFGIAKATSHELTEKTLFTEYGQFIGTPAYMSPEQAEMSGLDIDTRSDIYSLGVLLYELLTGLTPFDGKRLRSAGMKEIQRIIREEEPHRPSARLSEMSGDLPAVQEPSKDEKSLESQPSSIQYIAKRRHTDPSSLTKQMRGDLDWIVMKALEKDRARRYETANGFAMDIGRYLNDEPVLASPPSASYRLSKFVRRNRTAVRAAALVALALAAGVVGVTVGLVRAVRAEVRAEAEAERANTEKAIAEAVNEFLNQDLLAAVAPSAEEGRGRDVLMREVLDEAAVRIETASSPGGRFADKPLVEASIRATLGWTYRCLGEYDAAQPHLERARELRERELGTEHPDTIRSLADLAWLYFCQGRYDKAETLYAKTLAISKRVLGEEHPSTLLSMTNLAILYRTHGRRDEAERLHVKTLEIQKRVLGEEHSDTLNSMANLTVLYVDQGRYDKAEPLHVRTLEIRKRVLGEEHPGTLYSMTDLAILYEEQDRYDEAELLDREVLEIRRRVLGEEHPDTLSSMYYLARVLENQGQHGEAETLSRQAAGMLRRVLGEHHPDTLRSMDALARAHEGQGHYGEAEALRREIVGIRKTLLGTMPGDRENQHQLIHAYDQLGNLLEQQGSVADARTCSHELADYAKSFAEHGEVPAELLNCSAMALLTWVVPDLRDPVTALEFARKAVEANQEHPNFLDTLALAQQMTGDIDTAIET